jgi:hypothetical protein
MSPVILGGGAGEKGYGQEGGKGSTTRQTRQENGEQCCQIKALEVFFSLLRETITCMVIIVCQALFS